MAKLTFGGYHKLSRSTCANKIIEYIHYIVKPEHFQEGKVTGLPEAGDVVQIRNMPANMRISSMKLWIPDGKTFGANVDVGWDIEGAHPEDRVQDSTHNAPYIDHTLSEDPVFFGTGLAPAPGAGPGLEAIPGMPKMMVDSQYNNDQQPWLGYQWNLTITPGANLADGDELFIAMEYDIITT